MNKFFKSIALIILSSIAILANTAYAKDNFAIKEGSYTANFMNENTNAILSRGAAQIVIEKDSTGVYLQTKVSKECYKEELKLSQKRDPSGQLIFEVKPNNNACLNAYYLVKKNQIGFATYNAVANPQGIYVRVNEMSGEWTKD